MAANQILQLRVILLTSLCAGLGQTPVSCNYLLADYPVVRVYPIYFFLGCFHCV